MDFLSLSEVFSNRLFRVPDYQRGYAWRKDKEVLAFWNDLVSLQEGKSHFTGSLTLQQMTADEVENLGTDKWLIKNSFQPRWVVDGQQRLTTISIFMECLYEFLCEQPDQEQFFNDRRIKDVKSQLRQKYICEENERNHFTTYLFGYYNNEQSENYLRRHIYGDNQATDPDGSYYTLNMKDAKDFLSAKISELYENSNRDIKAIEILYKKLVLQLKFQLIEVKKDDDFNIFVAFETINNRGRQLSNLEKLKNRLIYLTTLFPMDDSTMLQSYRNHINGAWAEIYRQLGRNSKKLNGKVVVLDDDEFLKAHWIMYYKYSRQTGSDYAKFLLDQHFIVHNVNENMAKEESDQEIVSDEMEDPEELPATIDVQQERKLDITEIMDYATDLKNTAKMWYYTWFPRDAANDGLTNQEIELMERINRLGIAYFRPLITALFFGRLVGREEKNKKGVSTRVSEEKGLELLKAIERFIFIEFRLQTTRSHYGSSEFNRATRELHCGTKTVVDIIQMLNERVDKSFETDVTTGRTYLKTTYVQAMVKKLFEQKDDERAGFYRWSAIHYFLYEYNSSLHKEGYHGSEVSWDAFKQSENDKISIEHIFPHKAEGYWANTFKDVPQSQWPVYQGSLGNLLLLSQKINTQLQNDDFETKKHGRQAENPDKARAGYEKGSYSELEVSAKDDWTPKEIESRGMKMLTFMEEHWNFKFESDDVKRLLLLPL